MNLLKTKWWDWQVEDKFLSESHFIFLNPILLQLQSILFNFQFLSQNLNFKQNSSSFFTNNVNSLQVKIGQHKPVKVILHGWRFTSCERRDIYSWCSGAAKARNSCRKRSRLWRKTGQRHPQSMQGCTVLCAIIHKCFCLKQSFTKCARLQGCMSFRKLTKRST